MTPTEKLKQEVSELQIALSKETSKAMGLDSKDENIRREFAKAFGWYRSGNMFSGGRNELIDPSWPQIFVEVGKILNTRDVSDMKNDIDGLWKDMIKNSERITDLETQ